jgi:ABC-type nickel/cobalt efflux system permease component RcnA
VLTLLGPAIALLAGACAAWLSQHFPGLVTDESGTKAELTQAGTFIVGAVITWAIHHKYLDGWQRWETGVVQLEVQRRRHEQQLELQHRKHEHELELERARSHTHEHAHEDEDGHRHLHVKRHVSDDSAFGDPFAFEPFSDQARFAHDG